MNDCLAVILGGGRGTRLFPLTRQRSKPAVPIAGKYRLIDIPVSNCLNSNLRRIFVLTQYNSESLNKHVSMTYKFDIFSSGFVTILAAEQTEDSPEWFQGTADAVRQSMRHLRSHRSREVLILSGDQLYQMDFRKMLETHRRHVADATVAVHPGDAREQTAGLRDPEGRTARGGSSTSRRSRSPSGSPTSSPRSRATARASSPRWASTCSPARRSRRRSDDRELVDFGRHVIPKAIGEMRVQAHFFQRLLGGRGDDRLLLRGQPAAVRPDAALRLLRRGAARSTPTRASCPRPRSRAARCASALVSEGCILMGAEIERSVIGIRSRIGQGTHVREQPGPGRRLLREPRGDRPRAGAGACPRWASARTRVIERAIVDKNARVGRGVRILNEAGVQEADGDGYYIRDGIVIVPKGGVIPDGTVI